MPVPHTVAQARGRIGGLRNAALNDPKIYTQRARDARFRKFIDEIRAARPDITDEADIIARAEKLRTAEMVRLSLRAAQARTTKARAEAELRALEAELDATGLDDAGEA